MSTKVILNVYDLHKGNDYGYHVGLGLFHSGVEINGKEYSFGGHEYSFTGVFEVTPQCAVGVKFRESVVMGETTLPQRDIQDIIDELSSEFTGDSYHPINRNCNTFSNELIQRILKKPIPGYVNRLANMGSYLACLVPPAMHLLGIVPPPPTAAQASATSSQQGSAVVSGTDSQNDPFEPFPGKGQFLTESEVLMEISEEERRERAAAAAYKRIHQTTSSGPASNHL